MENIKIDPVAFFPPEVTENIFKYLSDKELLKSSLVSSDWYNLIAGSSKCMKKITIRVTFGIDEPAKSIISLLANSQRKYENLETTELCPGIVDLKQLLESPKRQWKRVKIARATFRDDQHALKYFGYFEKTVEDLTLPHIMIKNPQSIKIEANYIFPKLKNLTTGCIPSSLFCAAFNEVSNLDKFVLWGRDQSVASVNTISNLLKTNHKLKSLSIKCNAANIVLHQIVIKDIKFKLKELTITAQYHNTPYHDVIQQNFVALLKSQTTSLENLHLCDWMGINTLKACFGLTKLKVLTIKGFSNIEKFLNWEHLNLATNPSILELNLQGVPDDFEMLKTITSAAPNTTRFTVSRMDAQLLKHVRVTFKNLKHLTAAIIAPYGIPRMWHKSFKNIVIDCWKI